MIGLLSEEMSQETFENQCWSSAVLHLYSKESDGVESIFTDVMLFRTVKEKTVEKIKAL